MDISIKSEEAIKLEEDYKREVEDFLGVMVTPVNPKYSLFERYKSTKYFNEVKTMDFSENDSYIEYKPVSAHFIYNYSNDDFEPNKPCLFIKAKSHNLTIPALSYDLKIDPINSHEVSFIYNFDDEELVDLIDMGMYRKGFDLRDDFFDKNTFLVDNHIKGIYSQENILDNSKYLYIDITNDYMYPNFITKDDITFDIIESFKYVPKMSLEEIKEIEMRKEKERKAKEAPKLRLSKDEIVSFAENDNKKEKEQTLDIVEDKSDKEKLKEFILNEAKVKEVNVFAKNSSKTNELAEDIDLDLDIDNDLDLTTNTDLELDVEPVYENTNTVVEVSEVEEKIEELTVEEKLLVEQPKIEEKAILVEPKKEEEKTTSVKEEPEKEKPKTKFVADIKIKSKEEVEKEQEQQQAEEETNSTPLKIKRM